MKYETYEHLCVLNKHLFSQLEECTVMIRVLDGMGADCSFWRLKKARIKHFISENLEKTFRALIIEEANNTERYERTALF